MVGETIFFCDSINDLFKTSKKSNKLVHTYLFWAVYCYIHVRNSDLWGPLKWFQRLSLVSVCVLLLFSALSIAASSLDHWAIGVIRVDSFLVDLSSRRDGIARFKNNATLWRRISQKLLALSRPYFAMILVSILMLQISN